MKIPALALLCLLTAPLAVAQDDRAWPAEDWEEAAAADLGVDVGVLDALHREFEGGRHGNIDSMSVYRRGYRVYSRSYRHDYAAQYSDVDEPNGMYRYHDADWHPWYDQGDLHTIQSISKSVTSALIGIAIGRGEIPSVDVPMVRYFGAYEPAAPDPRRDAITIRDLLTMTAGIDWDESTTEYTDARNSAAALEASEEWVRFVLDQPMRADPGEEFEYNSGITILLAHILLETTGKQADEYAEEHLFGPLGIDRYYWKKTPTGLVDTEGGLYLEPDDLARVGYLYLNDGTWDGRRILPEGWVAETMHPAVKVPDWVASYGFQWWLLPYGAETGKWAYTGLGYGGQRLLVIPEYDLVAVFSGWNIDEIAALDPVMALERVLDSVR